MTPLLAQRPRSDRAFERLYKRHVGDVYRYALAVMRNPTDAEDVTQTTFLNAYRAYVEKGSRPEKPQNWLIAIAHNVCRQLDGRLDRRERGQLRAHLRECSECAAFARRQRAQRGAMKSLALVPVPSSLTSLFGGGSGTAIGTGLTLKAAAAVTAGLAIG